MRSPRVTREIYRDPSGNGYATACVVCGKVIRHGKRVYVVDPNGFGNDTCSLECGEVEAEALDNINPDMRGKW